MTKEEKSIAIEKISDILKSNQNIYLADISGLNALQSSSLRRMCFKAGVKLSVVKNTKVIKNFRKKSEKPILKGAMIEEDIYLGDDQLEILFAIKSKEELIADVISLLQSPAKNVISALKSSGGKLSGILETLSKK